MGRGAHVTVLSGRRIQTDETDGVNVTARLAEDAVGDKSCRAEKWDKAVAAASADVLARAYTLAD